MAPANQSRLSAEVGPPQLLATATERAGQRERVYQMPVSKADWRDGLVLFEAMIVVAVGICVPRNLDWCEQSQD